METSPPEPADEGTGTRPGKVRTWWHPLLANLLRWQLGEHYQLEEEVPVGQKPLQIDVLLLRKREGELPEDVRRLLAGLAEHFSEWTLLEFKSPTDTLRAGDLQTFLAYALLWRAQNQPLLARERLHMLVLAPRLTRPYREEMEVLGMTAHAEAPGIWSLQGGPVSHRLWVLETEILAGLEHPLLTLFSPQLLRQREQTYMQLQQGGYNTIVKYVVQQIRQFKHLGREFAMQHLGSEEEMQQVLRDALDALIREGGMTVSELYELVPALPQELRFAGMTPEQIIAALTPEKREQLRLLLQSDEDKERSTDRK
jgi:hypothetical protein